MNIKITIDAPELSKAIINLAEAIKPERPERPERPEKPADKKAEIPAKTKPEKPVAYTVEQIRAKAAELSKDSDKRNLVNAEVKKFASKLSAVKVEDYPALMKGLEAIK